MWLRLNFVSGLLLLLSLCTKAESLLCYKVGCRDYKNIPNAPSGLETNFPYEENCGKADPDPNDTKTTCDLNELFNTQANEAGCFALTTTISVSYFQINLVSKNCSDPTAMKCFEDVAEKTLSPGDALCYKYTMTKQDLETGARPAEMSKMQDCFAKNGMSAPGLARDGASARQLGGGGFDLIKLVNSIDFDMCACRGDLCAGQDKLKNVNRVILKPEEGSASTTPAPVKPVPSKGRGSVKDLTIFLVIASAFFPFVLS